MIKSVLLLAGICMLSALANASLIPTLASETAMGGDWAFNYSSTVTNDERLDPTATNGVTCPGPGNTLVQCNPSGTFFTIYDIPGFISASAIASGWTVTEQAIGITPSAISGSSFDSPTAMNVTFAYTGPTVAGSATFTGFQIVSTASGIDASGHFTSQSTRNVGDAIGTTNELAGSVSVPQSAVPEPDSLVLIGIGAIGIFLGSLRRARA